MCTEREYEDCKLEIAEESLEWACSKCKKRRPEAISPWTWHIIRLRRLQQAGYPFKPNDLKYEEWLDLGICNELIDQTQHLEVVELLKTNIQMNLKMRSIL